MSARESRPARPRPLARTRRRIPRKPWGMPSSREPGPARQNASGGGGGGGECWLGINQNPAAAWELNLGDSRGAPTRGLRSVPDCDERPWRGVGEFKYQGKGKLRQKDESLNTGNSHAEPGKGGAA